MSDCSVSRDDPLFLGPAALLKCHRFIFDDRDTMTSERLKLAVNYGLWKCTEMFACVEQCPKDIDVYEAIREIREETLIMGLKHKGRKYTESFTKSVLKTGKLNETKLWRFLQFGRFGIHPQARHPLGRPRGKSPAHTGKEPARDWAYSAPKTVPEVSASLTKYFKAARLEPTIESITSIRFQTRYW